MLRVDLTFEKVCHSLSSASTKNSFNISSDVNQTFENIKKYIKHYVIIRQL